MKQIRVKSISNTSGSTKRKEASTHITPEMLKQAQVESAKNLAGALLGVLGVLGLGAVLLTAPNLLMGIHGLQKAGKWFGSSQKLDEEKIKQTFYYLKRKGYIQFQAENSGLMVKLTGRGRDKLRKLQSLPNAIEAPTKWNGKWWLVASDVPTKTHRKAAEQLRVKLKQLNLYPFQRSLWVYPYDLRSELQYIIETYNIAQFVTVCEVSRFDKQDELLVRKHFKHLRLST